MKLPRYSCHALLCAIALAVLPVSAQITQTPPVTCTATNGTPRQVRVEGVAELMGDIVLNCTGGYPAIAGQPVPLANIRVALSSPITSRIFADGTAEPLLLIDEAYPSNPFPNVAGILGSPSPQGSASQRPRG